MIRLGLCCIFREEPIKFRRTTAKSLLTLTPRAERPARLAELIRHNLKALRSALEYCAAAGIGDFRINSQIFPLYTHPQAGYRFAELPAVSAGSGPAYPGAADGITPPSLSELAASCRGFAAEKDIRTGFHPDQFNVLSSPDPGVVERTLAELSYQAEASELLGGDVVTLHGGGGYGDKPSALERLAAVISRLPDPVRSRLALENDDRTYTPADLLPVCEVAGIPLVYDVHHHRVNSDGLTLEEATVRAAATWAGREPLFHLSSPLGGWSASAPAKHADYIDPGDFPECWKNMDVTVEVEAKAKELAVLELRRSLTHEGIECWDAEGKA